MQAKIIVFGNKMGLFKKNSENRKSGR